MPGLEEATGAARRETGERATPRPQEETAALPTYSSSSSAPHDARANSNVRRAAQAAAFQASAADDLDQNLAVENGTHELDTAAAPPNGDDHNDGVREKTAGGAIRFPPTLKQIARSRHLAAVDGATAAVDRDWATRRRRRFKALLLMPACAADSLARAGGAPCSKYRDDRIPRSFFRALLRRRLRRFAWPSRASRRRNPERRLAWSRTLPGRSDRAHYDDVFVSAFFKLSYV
ncbi:hypothetical protein MRX96_011264 [Rhipicephalus microplus]